MVRDYAGDAGDSAQSAKVLERDAAKHQNALLRWTAVNFAEAFGTWTHLKGVRLFVESVLRYGPAVRCETMLLLPGTDSFIVVRNNNTSHQYYYVWLVVIFDLSEQPINKHKNCATNFKTYMAI